MFYRPCTSSASVAPAEPNAFQADSGFDGQGDACDEDDDHDGLGDADLDGDHDVDGAAFELFFPCFRGQRVLVTFCVLPPAGSLSAPSAPDFDGNHHVDLLDVAVLQNTFTGSP
jgi:hypothetical protein